MVGITEPKQSKPTMRQDVAVKGLLIDTVEAERELSVPQRRTTHHRERRTGVANPSTISKKAAVVTFFSLFGICALAVGVRSSRAEYPILCLSQPNAPRKRRHT